MLNGLKGRVQGKRQRKTMDNRKKNNGGKVKTKKAG